MFKYYFFYIKANGIPSTKNYNYKKNLRWTSNDTRISRQQLFLDATYSFKQIVKQLTIRTIFDDAFGSNTFKLDLNNTQGTITEQRHRKFGRCYTFHPEKKIRDLGIYYIKTNL